MVINDIGKISSGKRVIRRRRIRKIISMEALNIASEDEGSNQSFPKHRNVLVMIKFILRLKNIVLNRLDINIVNAKIARAGLHLKCLIKNVGF